MTPAMLMSAAAYLAIHLGAAGLGAGFALLVSLLPWRWARYVVGWGVGALLFVVANALLFAINGASPNPSLPLAFAVGAIWCAWTLGRRPAY